MLNLPAYRRYRTPIYLLTYREGHVALAGLQLEERRMILDLVADIRGRLLPAERLRQLDAEETFPEDVIRTLLGPEIGLQLLFIPEAYGGLGGGARDVAAISEQTGRICLGVATGFFAIHLGADPILAAGTDAQKKKWLGRLADGKSIVAYAVTEPEAGSNLANLKTTATPVKDDHGNLTGYRINGTKQFISNGGYADFLTVLAVTPEGPSFFVVEKGMPGFAAGKAEDKHGIRASNTAPLTFEDVIVPVENLLGDVPGQGLIQANEVFGYTRLMVAAMGLGAGLSALEKAIAYAKERVQFGSPLIEKQGYTHKLLLPFAAKLEAAKAYIEEVAARLDAGETDLQLEGSIAKLFATETANSCADAAIQALGGYGYIREYDVEKIKRDVKITTIYEGTSEIQQLIVGTLRWKSTVSSKGAIYEEMAERMDKVHASRPDLKADVFAAVFRTLDRLFDEVHKAKAIRQQHVMFRLADLTSAAETGVALVSKVSNGEGLTSESSEYLALCARINAAFVAQTAFTIVTEILYGTGLWSAADADAIAKDLKLDYARFAQTQTGFVADMDALRAKV
jgi:alkylation response protein AidB-like acyl-CoA dehydrogenase